MPGEWTKNEHGLTRRQQQFADYRRSHPDETDGDCYMRFYSAKSMAAARVNASKLLKHPNVAKYLAEKQLQAEAKADYDQEQWVGDLIRLKEMCMAEADVRLVVEKVVDGEVQRVELSNRVFEPAAANKALDTLGKFKRWLSSDSVSGANQAGVSITNGVIFVGADGFGGVVGDDGHYLDKSKGGGNE